MYVFDQTGVVDSAKLIEYITKEFPGEFKRLIEARDELAKRQGALSAVDKANKDREKAAATLADAEAKASAMLADAQAEALATQAKQADLDVKAATLAQSQKAFAAESAAKAQEMKNQAQQLDVRERNVAAAQDECAMKLAALNADRAALDDRVKAFQAKVAALSA